jgi:hypothetical protein
MNNIDIDTLDGMCLTSLRAEFKHKIPVYEPSKTKQASDRLYKFLNSEHYSILEFSVLHFDVRIDIKIK